MDESLQLLPAVESLDLSRNKFAKVDNLRRCSKLKHIDLGFNQLRKVSHLSEVSCHLVKLVLRNNALTTLRGIHLKIYALSYVALPNDSKLDGKHIGHREFWKRQVVVTRRKSQPASYWFYSLARDEADDEGSQNRKKKKIYRLASINSEEESTYVNSDQESASCETETQSKEENIKSDHEADIFGLISKFEQLKKEGSVLWLREFKEWMDHPSEDFVDVRKDNWSMDSEEKYYTKNRETPEHHGETLRYPPVPLPGLQNTDLNQKQAFSPSTYLRSPPHYQKDFLYRRHNLVEEILQLSADSYSVALSDSMSSCSENGNYDSEQSNSEQDMSMDHLNGNRPGEEILGSAKKAQACLILNQRRLAS